MKEKIQVWVEGLSEEKTATKRELVLGAAVCALAGMVAGMLIAKVATGWNWSFSFASNNGNNNTNGGEISGAASAESDLSGKGKCRKGKKACKRAHCEEENGAQEAEKE